MTRELALQMGLLATQVLGGFAALVLLTIAPPAQGAMVLVPLDRSAREQVATLAIANGASLLKAGPLPYSLIVEGDRGRLLAPLGRQHILIFAASSVGCGTSSA